MKHFIYLLAIAWSIEVHAAIKTSAIEYRDGDAVLEGFFAYDDARPGLRPGVLVVHEWKGLGDYTKDRAQQLAALGYAAFAVDMYGQGVFAKTHEEAGKLSGVYRENRQLMRQRIKAGLATLLKQSQVDTSRVAAIGYCFGGMAVLELARSGAAVRGVVSFHGALNTPQAADAKHIKCKVLINHGDEDPYVKAEEVEAFCTAMRAAGVDWQLNIYSGAVHAFTVPEAGNDKSKGAAYNEAADKRSWEAMRVFFAEIFR